MGRDYIQRRADPGQASSGASADIAPGKRTLTEGMIGRQPEAAGHDGAAAESVGGGGGGGIAVVNAAVPAGQIKRDPGDAAGALAGSALGASDPTAAVTGATMGAALGGIARAPDGGIARQPPPGPGGRPAPAAAPAHPTSIASTATYGAALNYGKHFLHTFVSSTGRVADINNVNVGERITVARDDFGLGWGGVAMGALSARVNAAGGWGDEIGTPAAAIHPRMASVHALPAVLDTPQDLYWQDAAGGWNHFASLAITFTVRRAAGGGLEAVTVDNGVPFVEPFTGPAPAAPPAPAPGGGAAPAPDGGAAPAPGGGGHP